jgi:iron-sulfur cluster insertion protein
MLSLSISPSAAARIHALRQAEGKPVRFRISVKGGGCSGFQYEFSLDDAAPADDDRIFTQDTAEVIIDETSLGIIAGSTLDFTEDLAHAGFAIKNPNATAKCGCGNSFSVSL